MSALAIYIHWPFCLSKCPYCDFNSRPIQDSLDQKAWAKAYVQDLLYYAQRLPNRIVGSIYFGGGTPSLMHAQTVEVILDTIAAHWSLADNCEITLEANPSSATHEKLQGFRTAGVNRISMGVQSFDDKALKFLGRAHSSHEACQAIETIAGLYDRYSFDLIYARAEQTLQSWEDEMHKALSFSPKHLSLYQLTIEPQTVFYKRSRNEQLNAEETLCAEMYELTQSVLGSAGLPAYEISNHAALGEESRHNLAYWHYDDYIGIGPGAHGRFIDAEGRWATEAESVPAKWLGQLPPRAMQENVDIESAKREALMMGLRLVRGIDKAAWKQKFGIEIHTYIKEEKRSALVDEGLLLDNKDVFCATAQGLERLNAVLNYLL